MRACSVDKVALLYIIHHCPSSLPLRHLFGLAVNCVPVTYIISSLLSFFLSFLLSERLLLAVMHMACWLSYFSPLFSPKHASPLKSCDDGLAFPFALPHLHLLLLSYKSLQTLFHKFKPLQQQFTFTAPLFSFQLSPVKS